MFNYFINSEMRFRSVVLPITKPKMLSKVSNLIKYRFRCRIVFWLGLCALKVAIKLLKLTTAYKIFDNILQTLKF